MNIHNDTIAPRLVSKKTVKKLEKIFQNPVVNEPTWRDNLLLFYSDNIKPNLFAIIIFFIVAVFLTIKYLLKQEKDEKKERALRKKKHIRKLLLQNKLRKQMLDSQMSSWSVPDDTLNTLHKVNNHNANDTHDTHDIYTTTKQKKSKKHFSDDDIYYRASDVEPNFDIDDEIENRSDDEVSFYSLSKDYEKMIEENDGTLPVGMLKDAYEQKKTKTTFDELAKLVSGK